MLLSRRRSLTDHGLGLRTIGPVDLARIESVEKCAATVVGLAQAPLHDGVFHSKRVAEGLDASDGVIVDGPDLHPLAATSAAGAPVSEFPHDRSLHLGHEGHRF